MLARILHLPILIIRYLILHLHLWLIFYVTRGRRRITNKRNNGEKNTLFTYKANPFLIDDIFYDDNLYRNKELSYVCYM